ncbi:MAG: phosphotransferase [bacterium]
MENRIRQALAARFDAQTAERAKLENLGGHASLRIYWRITLPSPGPRGESTLMAMVMPLGDDALKSEEGGSGAVPPELPFINVQRYLSRLELPVPQIDHTDMAIGVLLLEDLGQEMFENAYLANPGNAEHLYQQAIDLLIRYQKAVETDTVHDCIAWDKSFDQPLLRWEMDHYREWGLDAQHGAEHAAARLPELEAAFDRVVATLLEAPQTLSLRDYQSRNIMRKNGAWILIDFQDALRGSCVYDLVALLRDSYIVLEPPLVQRLVQYYAEQGAQAGLSWCSDASAIHTLFHVQTVQRKLKDAGRFIFIDRVKGNPSFLPYYEPSIGYVKNALHHLPQFSDLQSLLVDLEPAFA